MRLLLFTPIVVLSWFPFLSEFTARRLKPLLDRMPVEKIVAPTRTAAGILLPETTTKYMDTMNIESSAKTELSFVEMRIIGVDRTKMQEIGMSSREGIITS